MNTIHPLDSLLSGSPFLGYAYGYPHKTAYRPLTPPVPLAELWADEPRDDTALYLHIPFCEMRCGFCNLFTTPNPTVDTEERYLNALERQAAAVEQAIGTRKISRVAFGGGTPTFLSTPGIERVLQVARQFAGDLKHLPISVETSPRTAEPEKLALLREYGVDRISMGVQSFVAEEVRTVGRAQQNRTVFDALEHLREAGFPTLNLDLIYGIPGQTESSWAYSLEQALAWHPEELYLYPLYVRPLTGLDNRAPADGVAWDNERMTLYRQARDTLLSSGYEQVSLRFFRRIGAATHPSSDAIGGNLIGLGCGARSYTRALHYSSEWAVGRAGVRSIVADYLIRSDADFAIADYGVRLTTEEQKRRFLIYSLLQQSEGVPLGAYHARFDDSDLLADFPQLVEMQERGLAVSSDTAFALTERGWEWADVLGPYLTSDVMRQQMETFALK
ncbi:MAG: STM4012 family radical SAM protein [Fibrella sp.]|nr:STM4012 family radical SAM protein [Armatimonadota bacterium]